jgi:hypothetical protein
MDDRSRFWLLTIVFLLSGCQSGPRPPAIGEPPEYITDPSSILRIWNCLGAHKEVTREYPTDYRIGGVYRLLQDVVVTNGDTASLATPYWISGHETSRMESVRGEIAANQAAGRRETRTVLPAGTPLRFDEIWLEGNFETGIYVHPYATVLDGPLQGQLIGIGCITDRTTEPGTRRERCNVNPAYLELVAR